MIGRITPVCAVPAVPVREPPPVIFKRENQTHRFLPPSSFHVPSIFLLGLPIIGTGLLFRRFGMKRSPELVEEAGEWLVGRLREYEKLDRIVSQLMKFSPSERRVALQEVRRMRGMNDLRRFFELALYDSTAWRCYLKDVGRRGTYHPTLYTTLDPILASMPPELRTSLYREVRRLYPLADKGSWSAYLILPPKRALDAFIRGTLRPDEIIQRERAKGKTTWGAYEPCFREWRLIFSGTPYGDYSPDDVRAVVDAVRRILKREAKGRNWSVTLGGSFPNGRALIDSSDIDLFVSDPRIADLFPEMDRTIAMALRPRHRRVGLHLHQAPPNWVEAETARINPVLIRIKPSSCELVVYPPVKQASEEAALAPVVWPKPNSYPL